jgi:hypothetical protein
MIAGDCGRGGLRSWPSAGTGRSRSPCSGNQTTSTASVVVWNWRSGVCLQLNAEPEDAAYAFAHPYAYAAAQGLPHRDIQSAA